MRHRPNVEPHADSLIEILTAQCADLEKLLAEARRQTVAVERDDFDEVLRIVGERAALGERLEVYHRQIAELRARMGEGFDAALNDGAARRASGLVVQIQAQDARTLPLLLAARDEAAGRSLALSTGQRTASAYARTQRRGAVACDRLA